MKAEKLWGKRFENPPSPLAQKFTSGRDVQGKPAADERLIPYDIWGSRAHVVMLAKAGLLAEKQARILSKGLRQIEELWRQGKFPLDPSQEDVHTNIESWLTEKYGVANGRKASYRPQPQRPDRRGHAALSSGLRPDLFHRSSFPPRRLDPAGEESTATQIFPGYTHHQPAQVTTFGHILLGFGESFLRDAKRFQEWFDRFN